METFTIDALKTQAAQRFDRWVSTIQEDQRRDSQLIQGHMLLLAREVTPDPAGEEYDDDIIRAILRSAIEDTSLAVNQPKDIDDPIMDYSSNAAHLRPIVLICSNMTAVVDRHLRNHWRQHVLNPYRETYG